MTEIYNINTNNFNVNISTAMYHTIQNIDTVNNIVTIKTQTKTDSVQSQFLKNLSLKNTKLNITINKS